MGRRVRRLGKGTKRDSAATTVFRCQSCGKVWVSAVSVFVVCDNCGSNQILPVQKTISGYCVWENAV